MNFQKQIKKTQPNQVNNKLDIEALKLKFINKQIVNNYKILSFLDNGSFCAVFKAIYQKYEENDKTKKLQKQKMVCFKVEDHFKNGQKSSCTLEREARVLKDMGGEIGFPKLYYFQKEERHSFVFTSLLGKNLSYYHKQCDKKFSVQTVSMIAYQFIKRIKVLHAKGFLHRDIKPDNMMLGSTEDQQKTVYMVDFGLSTIYISKDGQHVPYQENVGSIGTMRFNSINCHRRNQQSRRDDLQSFGYVLVYLFKGNLPWQVIQINDFWERNDEVQKLKEQITPQYLCNGLPEEFLKYFEYVNALEFYQEPDYEYLIQLFYNLIVNNQWNINFFFDWQQKKNTDVDSSYSYQKRGSEKQLEIKSLNKSHKRYNSVNKVKKLKAVQKQQSLSKNNAGETCSNGGFESNNTSFQSKFSVIDLQKQFSIQSKFKKRGSIMSINMINNSEYISKNNLNKYQHQCSSHSENGSGENTEAFLQTLHPQMGSSVIQNQQHDSSKTFFSTFHNIDKSERTQGQKKPDLNIVNETYLDNFDSLQDYNIGGKTTDQKLKKGLNSINVKVKNKSPALNSINQDQEEIGFDDDLTVDIQGTSIDVNHTSMLNFNNNNNKNNKQNNIQNYISLGDKIQQKSFDFNVKKLRQNNNNSQIKN